MNPPLMQREPPRVAVPGPAEAPVFYDIAASPIGNLLLVGDGEFLIGLYMAGYHTWPGNGLGRADHWRIDKSRFAEARAQLAAYFSGRLRRFDLPLKWSGTEFQKAVWQALTEIPFGVTVSYGEQARRIGQPAASRAVGLANGRNPISIIVPCHRVIGSNGALTGYGGGIERKRWLLRHEGVCLTDSRPPAQSALF